MLRSFQNIAFLPVLHGSLEFAAVVRRELLAAPPAVVAVELPATWREPILQGVNRLPYLSLVMGEHAAESRFLAIEPTEPLVEALRTARELGVPVELIDLDVDTYTDRAEPVPDSHAVGRLGYEAFLAAYYDSFGADAGDPNLGSAATSRACSAPRICPACSRGWRRRSRVRSPAPKRAS
jgi:hypothetical protein